jgi:glycosyltransferase involved in cell wall biosynthesis
MEKNKMNTTLSNMVCVDWKPGQDWEFMKHLEAKTGMKWNIIGVNACQRRTGIIDKIINVYAKYFLFSFRIFFNRNEYKYLLAWQQFFGILLAFYCILFNVKKYPKIIILTFIYKEKQGIFKYIYYKFIKTVLKSKYICKIICFAASEKEYYLKKFNLSEDKIVHTYYGIEPTSNKAQFLNVMDNKYFLSVGRSNRDYEFLFDAFEKNKEKLIVLCDDIIPRKSENITTLNNIFGDEYINYLSNCIAVIIPLKDENISSGQLVFLRALELGKPVIVTTNNTITEYLKNGYNCIVIEKTFEALSEAINRIKDDKEFYSLLVNNGKKTFNERFTIDKFSESLSQIIKGT